MTYAEPFITQRDKEGFSDLFKTQYGEWMDSLYGTGQEDPIEACIPKQYGLGGKGLEFPIKVGFGGGTGFGTLPEANHTKNITIKLDSYSAYGRYKVDRRTILMSRGNSAAFRSQTGEGVEAVGRNFIRTQVLALCNGGMSPARGDLVLGQFGAAATGTAAEPVVTILGYDAGASSGAECGFRPAYFEEGDYVQVEKDVEGTPVLQAGKWEIKTVDVENKQVTLTRLPGNSIDLTDAGFNSQRHNLVLQGASYYDASTDSSGANTQKVPVGLLGLKTFSSGQTMYGADYQRRFKPLVRNNETKLLTVTALNNVMIEFQRRTGRVPNKIFFSYKQYEKFLNQEESKKRYQAATFSGNNSYKLKSGRNAGKSICASFDGITYMSQAGAVQVMPSRYLRDDMVCGTIDDKNFRKHVDPFVWFQEDGTVLIRLADTDAFEARYGGYYENFLHPFYWFFIENCSV